MNRFAISSVVVILLFILAGCSATESVFKPAIDISPDVSGNYDWLTIADTTVISLETADGCLIGQVAGICHDGAEWYILTRDSNILKFDKSGRFITSVGSKGNGPGEYMRVNTMCVSDGKVYVIEGNQNKVCVYDTDGKWEKDIPETGCLKFSISMKPMDDGRFMVANGISFDKDTPLYGVWDPSEPHRLKPVIRTGYTYQGNYEWAMAPMAEYKDKFMTLKPLSSTVWQTDAVSAETDSLINIADCIPEDINTTDDYRSAFKEILRQKGNPIMGIHIAGDIAFINLLRAFAICHLPSGKWWYAGTGGISLQKSPLPFMLIPIVCSFGNRLVCVVDASTYLDVYAKKPEFGKILHSDIATEDNPVLMIYTVSTHN